MPFQKHLSFSLSDRLEEHANFLEPLNVCKCAQKDRIGYEAIVGNYIQQTSQFYRQRFANYRARIERHAHIEGYGALQMQISETS